jgi:hypothetical protein
VQIKTSFLIVFLLLVLSSLYTPTVYAQGSAYDWIGFGDPVISESARMEGIAGAGVANGDSRTINDLNPAAFSMLSRARIEARLNFFYNRTDLGSDEGIQRIVKFAGASFATPLFDKNHIGFSLGFAPLTNADAQTQHTDSLGTTLYTRQGGLSQLYLGLSARPISSLNIGARADFLFGNLREISQANVSQGVETVPSTFQREYAISGTRGTFGFLLTLDTLVPELHGLTIGGSYSMGTTLNSRKRTIVTPVNSALDSTIEDPGYGYYPSLIRLGIATRIGNRYRVEADISGQDFSNASFYSATSPVLGDPQLGTSNRYSFGLERLPIMGDESKGVPFWEKTGLRLGFNYATLPFRPVAGVTVNEMSVTAGIGIPMNPESIFDFSAEIGLRTPSNTALAPKEYFFKMGASISLSEKWFVPLRKEEE